VWVKGVRGGYGGCKGMPFPYFWLEVPKEDRLLLYGNLTVPNLKYGFPEELGGRQWPEGPPGNFSSDFEQMLKSDCPHCAWWPEERPTIAQEQWNEILSLTTIDKTTASLFMDPSVAPEVFGKSPHWFAASLMHARKGTTVGLHAVKQGYPAIGHVFGFLQNYDYRHYKLDARKLFGRYNWRIGRELGVLGGTPLSVYGYSRLTEHAFSKVLALSPQVDLSRTRSWSELASILIGLYQVAFISGRVLALPQVPCEAPWLHAPEKLSNDSMKGSLCKFPLSYAENEYILYGTDPKSGELIGGWARRRSMAQDSQDSRDWLKDAHRFMGSSPFAFDGHCLRLGSMSPPEFFHWIKNDAYDGNINQSWHAHPQESNTVFVPDPNEADLQLKPSLIPWKGSGSALHPSDDLGWSWFDVQARLRSHDVAREMERVASEPLVFVGHPIMVVHHEATDSVRDVPNILLGSFNSKIRKYAKEQEALCRLLTENPFNTEGGSRLPSLKHGMKCFIAESGGKVTRERE
jgi:hypothetical protein